VIIFGTGYKFQIPYLPEMYQKYVQDDGIALYKHMIHPHIPNVGFIGYNHSLLHLSSVELGCIWLLALIRGDFKLPSEEEQMKYIEYITKWKRENMAHNITRISSVNVRVFNHFEELLSDLKCSTQRKPFFIDYLQWYTPGDYENVMYEVLSN